MIKNRKISVEAYGMIKPAALPKVMTSYGYPIDHPECYQTVEGVIFFVSIYGKQTDQHIQKLLPFGFRFTWPIYSAGAVTLCVQSANSRALGSWAKTTGFFHGA